MILFLQGLRIKQKVNVLIGSLILLALISLFGLNELSKAQKFTFLEREHIVLTNEALDRINSLKSSSENTGIMKLINNASGSRSDMGLNQLIGEIKQQPLECLDTVNAMEVILFRIAGFGEAIDLCHKDISDADKALQMISDFSDNNQKERFRFLNNIEDVVTSMHKTSIRFSQLIPEIVVFVKTLITLTVLFVAAGAIFVLWIIMKDVRDKVVMLSDIFTRIGKTQDLTARAVYKSHNNNSSDEVTVVCENFNRMMDQFESIMIDISNHSSELSSATEALYSISEETSSKINHQHQETEMVATAVQEMASAVEEIARNTTEAATSGEEGHKDASSGRSAADAAIASVNSLSGELTSMNEVVSQLDTDSTAIGGVLDVIRGVAEQTNLLALNAAIEAARAGEQGRGFAVVADEVRQLASRTQQSTEEIQVMIERLQQGTEQAVSNMETNRTKAESSVERINTAGDSLRNIERSTEVVRDVCIQIASATEEQTGVTDEIQRSLVNIQSLSGETSEAAQKIHDASQRISTVATNMQTTVVKFRLNR